MNASLHVLKVTSANGSKRVCVCGGCISVPVFIWACKIKTCYTYTTTEYKLCNETGGTDSFLLTTVSKRLFPATLSFIVNHHSSSFLYYISQRTYLYKTTQLQRRHSQPVSTGQCFVIMIVMLESASLF